MPATKGVLRTDYRFIRFVNVRIIIKTQVEQQWAEIQKGFNEELFLQLNPPFPKVKIAQFDGSKKGDQVSMELNFGLWKDHWTSLITHDKTHDSGFDFIDEGTKLPFPFRYWRHHHIVEKNITGSVIIDDITFKSPLKLLDVLLYPLLYAQFLYRRPVYKRLFRA